MTLPPALPRGDFVTTYESATYVCEPRLDQNYNCYPGTRAPQFDGSLALYCSGNQPHLECSRQWYPNVLDRYTTANVDGSQDLCEAPVTSWASGDEECVPYAGGDPTVAWLGSPLKCSQAGGGSLTCEHEYFPSELAALHLTLAKIGAQQYVCKPQSGLEDCYRWDGYNDPQYAARGAVALYCTSEGVCTENRPSA